MNAPPDTKLPFFPSPCLDELLYSAFARYHHDSGNLSIKATVTDLFGTSTACAVLDLPNRIEQFCQMLSTRTLLTPDRLVNDHTMLPLYRPFLPRQRLNKLVSWMKGATRGGSIHMSSGVMASSIHSPGFLRCCPSCLVEDKKSDAEQPYWHRSHQVAGVWVCHIHGSWLLETTVPIAAAANKHAYFLPPAIDQLHLCRQLGDERFFTYACQIANSVAWLLKASADLVPGLHSLQKRYLHLLWQKDLTTHSGRVRQREFLDHFLSHYGADFLNLLDCGIDPDAKDNWLSALVRKPRKATHPLRHILLMHFLGLGSEQFMSGRTPENRPFGRGPWPCLNPVAPHYRESVITRCQCDHTNERGEPVAIFTCECGFSYGRACKTGEPNDRMRVGWHVSFGQLWEAELIRLIRQEGISLRETARKLEVDVNTVRFQLQRIENHKKQDLEVLPTVDSLQEERLKRHSNWLAILKSHPDLGRKAVRMQAKADFAWLYRHDYKWLYEHQPNRIVRTPPKPKVDWQERDRGIAKRIKPTVQEILQTPGLPRRITVSLIGKQLGLRALFEKKLHKLPRVAKKLKFLTDSDESFAERRISYAIGTLREEGNRLEPWLVLRRASIRGSPTVHKIIEVQLAIYHEM